MKCIYDNNIDSKQGYDREPIPSESLRFLISDSDDFSVPLAWAGVYIVCDLSINVAVNMYS